MVVAFLNIIRIIRRISLIIHRRNAVIPMVVEEAGIRMGMGVLLQNIRRVVVGTVHLRHHGVVKLLREDIHLSSHHRRKFRLLLLEVEVGDMVTGDKSYFLPPFSLFSTLPPSSTSHRITNSVPFVVFCCLIWF